jgi:hypothetical protein
VQFLYSQNLIRYETREAAPRLRLRLVASGAFPGPTGYGFQRNQIDRKDRVSVLEHLVDEKDVIHQEILEMIKEFFPKLLNQLMKELKTAMNLGSTKPLSIKFWVPH